MINLKNQLGTNETIEYIFRPSRKAFLREYLLFAFVMLLSFTSLYPALMTNFKNIAILNDISMAVFYILLVISIVLLIKVEYKIWSKLYALTNKRVIISKGIFSEDFQSTVYDKITDIELKQSFLDKILNIGKIGVNTAGGDEIEFVFENTSRPLEVKNKINNLQAASQITTTPTIDTTTASVRDNKPVRHRRKK
jgi:uncharacterized membrane protein YdbT with pleckstrin-like domain